MSVKLLSFARISAGGLLAAGPGGTRRTSWRDLGAPPPDETGLPELRARWFFDEPFPKFGRMDPLCRLGVGTAALAFGAAEAIPDPEETGQVGGTMLGCLEVDGRYDDTLAAAASPALFVYTLPSMLQGEIAIRWRLQGPCTLLGAGRLSALTALRAAVRKIELRRARSLLVVGADAAGAEARRLYPDEAAPSAAWAWLLAAGDPAAGSVALLDSAGEDEPATALARREAGWGTTCVDSLEEILLDPPVTRRVCRAELGGFSVSLAVRRAK